MRVQFIPDGASDTPLMLLSFPKPGDLSELYLAVGNLARRTRTHFTLHSDDESEHQTSVHMSVSEEDAGLTGLNGTFQCSLRAVSWAQIEGLLEPFVADDSCGYQWLDESGPIALLLSPSGEW